MELKRLGLAQKSLFVVPNHLTEQWASDFLRLYPGANILAATKKDFEPANRKKFCSRIATGDYDAVIIGHTQFEKISMRNVAGIIQTEAQKSQDMFNKCQYLDELTGGKGMTFATGTPISNSMTELYTNMRYLQYGTLQKLGLGQFDAWAANFGDTQTAIEFAQVL